MSLNEVAVSMPLEHMANVFGKFDEHIRKIEKTLGVTVVLREN